MKPLLVSALQVCLLWLLICCTVTASKSYTRSMWVSTTGEDSPWCIHDTPSPARDPVTHPRHSNESCGTLSYALNHIQNDTYIGVLCGIHKLKPLNSSPEYTPLSYIKNVNIVGALDCSIRRPQIHCTNGANLAFYNVELLRIGHIEFNHCGEQLQYSESLSRSSVLYFQDCNTLVIQHINITISGLYGRGISYIRYNETVANRDVLTEFKFVSVYHYGFHGSGIHCEVVTAKGNYMQTAKFQMIQKNIQVYSESIHLNKNLTTSFTGINITVMGDGEGGEITLANVTVIKNTSGAGISFSLLDNVSRSKVQLSHLYATERLEKLHNMYNSSVPINGVSSAANRSTAYSSIKIELRDNSKENHMQIERVWVVYEGIVTPGSSFCIEVTGHSEGNYILLDRALLTIDGSSSTNRRGLEVILTRMAMRNRIIAYGLTCEFHKAYWGGGAYVEFSGNAMGNFLLLDDGSFNGNHAYRGGGIAVVCKELANQNEFQLLSVGFFHGSAQLGGGVYIILQGSSNKNTISLIDVVLFNNTAHCGGGLFIHFQETSVASSVEILYGNILNNTLFPSEKYDMMGAGVHVEFSTIRATFRTDNIVNFTQCWIALNTAVQGFGGGISLLYKHSFYQGDSGDRVILDIMMLLQNKAASGCACAFQSLPIHGKRLFRGVRITDTIALLTNADLQPFDYAQVRAAKAQLDLNDDSLFDFMDMSAALFLEQVVQAIDPSFQVKTNKNMFFAKSVQITVGHLTILCGTISQGIYALGSEIVLQANTPSHVGQCVATHGGDIALYGESHIRTNVNAGLVLSRSYAFQRGGAIYASSALGVVPVSECFLQEDELQEEENSGVLAFGDNSANAEGLSVYVSDVRKCLDQGNGKNVNKNAHPWSHILLNAAYDNEQVFESNFTYIYNKEKTSNDSESWRKRMKEEVMSGPSHVAGTLEHLDKLTIQCIPGKQVRLPYTYTYDQLGSIISSVFAVLINKLDDSIPVELHPFSKFTADFTVILHGIPQQHGKAKHFFPSNTNNTSAVVRPPQLVLQSLDNKELLLVMNIQLLCCPPGYIFRYGSENAGKCHCGIFNMNGIVECNESHYKVIGAVLERDHWAGYLPSNDQHSCGGQKFFTGSCPPGYCQTQTITLPQNNSQQGLQDVVCAGSDRKGLLCGDCVKEKGIAVNFNGIRPVCTSCEEGLSNVGVLIWILSEWVPMLTFMFILMLFNIDLVSGSFNSFLLFAQLLAFSSIRGDAELGPVHNAFVRIYRFLYGMWNLDFFGVLLPPYCLAPNANLTLLQTLLVHYSIGLFPLTVAITLIVLERSAEKWICCHRVDQCLRRMRRWKAKYSDGMSYDRALPAFVILGFTRFLVSSSYILVHHTLTGEDGERKVVVWWQGSVPYGSIQHIAYFIPAIVILLVFVLLPSFLLLTLPIGPQLFGRLLIAVPPLRKLQRMQTFCSNIYTDRWVYHFVNVFQGCYKERFRSFSSLYLIHRIVHLLVAVFTPRAEDALRIQIFLTVALLLLIATLQPYNSHKLNTLDAAILGSLALILILSLHVTDLSTPIGTRQFYASIQMILIYLPLLYPGILLGNKVYLKCRQLRCCQKQEEQREDNAEPLLEAPAERLGNLVLITELRAGVPTSEDDDTVTETETEMIDSQIA